MAQSNPIFWPAAGALCLLTPSLLLAQAPGEAALFEKVARNQDASSAVQLAQRGPAAAPFLLQGLERGGRVGALCAWALWQHPQPAAAPALRAQLLGVNQVAGYWAARALGRLPGSNNVSALASLLPNATNGFWELSSGGVGRLTDGWDAKGQRYNVPAPTNMANLRVAYAAMEALGELGGPEALRALTRALDNDQYLIRYGAARGLGRAAQKDPTRLQALGAVEAVKLRLGALAESDPVWIVRLGAQQALAMVFGHAGRTGSDLLSTSPLWQPAAGAEAGEPPPRIPSIAFIKTPHRSESNLGFRDSYFFPKTPRHHSGENLYTLTPARPDGTLRNLTQLQKGEVQGPEVSFDGARILFAMRRDRDRDGFHIFEINADGSGLRQITDGNCNDSDPCYLPDGRIAFCSDRAGYQEYYHQERSRVIYVMEADGSKARQVTFNPNQDYEPLALADGRIVYGSYRFYAQDGSEGPLRGEWMGLARIETVLRSVNPDGSADQLYYGSMRGSFYSPMRPMPFSDQWAGWHRRGYHVGVSVSQARELPGGRLVCTSPAGLTVLDASRLPIDCEAPVFPEIVNLAGGEEVYIHNYDEMNPVGRFTSPCSVEGNWMLVSHAPWHDLRPNGYGLRLMNLATRQLELVYDDPAMAEVDPLPLVPRTPPAARESTLSRTAATGFIYCNSVFNSDLPYDRKAVRQVRVIEGVLMGQSIAANAAFRTRNLGTVPIHPDGSFYVEVPADTPLRFELLDEAGQMLVHETEFNFVRPGETKGCLGCHEPRKGAALNQRPLATQHPPAGSLRQRGDLIYMGKPNRPYNWIYRE